MAGENTTILECMAGMDMAAAIGHSDLMRTGDSECRDRAAKRRMGERALPALKKETIQ